MSVAEISKKWADWLVDAVAGATQDRRFLRGDPAEDKLATEALYVNGRRAIEMALNDEILMRQPKERN